MKNLNGLPICTLLLALMTGCGEENQAPKQTSKEKIAAFKRKLAEVKRKNKGKIPLETVLHRKVSQKEISDLEKRQQNSGRARTAQIIGEQLDKRHQKITDLKTQDKKTGEIARKSRKKITKASASVPKLNSEVITKAKALKSTPPTGLVAWYRLDGNFKDSSGNGLDLTPVASGQPFAKASAVRPNDNKCFGPVTSNNKRYGAVGPVLPLNNKTGFTICGFVAKPRSNNYQANIFGCGSGQYGKGGALFYAPYGVLNSKVGSNVKAKAYKRMADGLWHHHAIVVPAQGSGKSSYTVYIDGKKAYDSPMQYLDNYGPFMMGKISGSQASGFRIDDIKIFNKPLTEAQLRTEAKMTGSVKQQTGGGGDKQRIKPEKYDFPIKGKLEVRFYSPKVLCVVGNYNDFIRDRFKIECGTFLRMLDTGQKFVKKWSYNFYYRYAALDVIADYRPKIQDSFQKPEYFTFSNVQTGQKLKIKRNGYWINAVGQMRVPIIATGKMKMIEAAAVAHFAYIELEKPLEPGQQYELTTSNNEKVSFVWDGRKSVSKALKVNQVGYLPDAGLKYAYLGGWLATMGKFEPENITKKKFQIIDEETGKSVFSGPVKFRSEEQFHNDKRIMMPLYGETVWDMDFSKFTTPGKYHLYVPGIGISDSFKLSHDAIAKAFYTHIRGLYHQRSGIAKKPPYTNWIMGVDHKESWKGRFIANEALYYKKQKFPFGFRGEDGKSVTLKHFTMIRETATDVKLPNVWGGWWDAGDFDRREQHFRIVEDLLSAYLMFPKKFSDGQLHIPESGNGIPDIVDEVLWCMEMWRRAQSKDGGIGCWIEADSHPNEWNPAKDKQRYYLAAPTVQSSLRYSVHAGLTAIALRKCGQQALADKYHKSAEKAFFYAIAPRDAYFTSWLHYDRKKKRKVTWTYRENPKLPKDLLFRAALHLFILSGNQDFYRYLKPNAFGYALMRTKYPDTPFSLTALAVTKDLLPDYQQKLRDEVLRQAETWMYYQQQAAYRNFWYPANHKFFRHMAWGNVIPFTKGRYLSMAMYLTKDKKYRDAALLLNDWMLGTNPMGRSLTTGLGHNRPIRVLSLASYSDGILQPLPGITLYTFTSRIAYKAKTMVYALNYQKRASHRFAGLNMCLLPKSLTKGKNLSYKEIGTVMDAFCPVWRRFNNIEQYAVDQNEFTVWETIGPCAAFTACLLPDNWKPPASWKDIKPKEKLSEMPGYLFQP
jgi:endoglucanase